VHLRVGWCAALCSPGWGVWSGRCRASERAVRTFFPDAGKKVMVSAFLSWLLSLALPRLPRQPLRLQAHQHTWYLSVKQNSILRSRSAHQALTPGPAPRLRHNCALLSSLRILLNRHCTTLARLRSAARRATATFSPRALLPLARRLILAGHPRPRRIHPSSRGGLLRSRPRPLRRGSKAGGRHLLNLLPLLLRPSVLQCPPTRRIFS
jgi:hypothetical protein